MTSLAEMGSRAAIRLRVPLLITIRVDLLCFAARFPASLAGQDCFDFHCLASDTMSFNTTAILLTLTMIFFGGSAAAHHVRNENAGEACRARTNSAPGSDVRWMYRTDRKTGEKCWFLAAGSKPVTSRHVAALAYDDEGIADAKPKSTSCIRSPDGPTQADSRWRYRFDRMGQRCWHLVGATSKAPSKARMRVTRSNDSGQFKREKLGLLQLFVNAAARLSEADNVPPESLASTRESNSNEAALSEAHSATFENRWIDSAEMIQPSNPSRSAFSAFADTNRPGLVRHSPTRGSVAANTETTFRLLLLATVATIGIAVGVVPRDSGREP
jgi:hypothetical protein